MAFERVAEGSERMLVVVNCGRGHWQKTEYGVWVGSGGGFEEVFCSQSTDYGGWEGWVSNKERGVVYDHDGKLYINVPPQCCLVFRQV